MLLLSAIGTTPVYDARVFRGADCGSDHHLVKASVGFFWTLQNKLVKAENSRNLSLKNTPIKVELLQDESIAPGVEIRSSQLGANRT